MYSRGNRKLNTEGEAKYKKYYRALANGYYIPQEVRDKSGTRKGHRQHELIIKKKSIAACDEYDGVLHGG